MKPRPKALIIDDELANRRLVRIVLESDGYKIFEAGSGAAGSHLAGKQCPDVIILDLGLPDISGIMWLKSFRDRNQTPVLVLSAHCNTIDKVAALDSGANDYLVKPFGTLELLARLRVLRRCVPGIPEEIFLTEGGIKVNLADHEVSLNGCPLKLTVTEEALFYVLVRHVGKVVTCEHLLRSVWGTSSKNKLHELQVLIARLRRKVSVGDNSVSIRTEARIGYQLLVANHTFSMQVIEDGKDFSALNAWP